MTHSFPRNRYPAEMLLSVLDTAPIQIDNESCRIYLLFENETDIELILPVESGQWDERFKAQARALLAEISRLDDLVQESCERAWAGSTSSSDEYDLYLAYIELGPEELLLGYFGARVNTDWEARFKLENGRWQPNNF